MSYFYSKENTTENKGNYIILLEFKKLIQLFKKIILWNNGIQIIIHLNVSFHFLNSDLCLVRL